jgi:hypothetical protein
MTAGIACALFMNGVERVAAARRTGGLVLDISVCAKEFVFGRSGGFWLLSINRPTHFGGIDVSAVGATHLFARSLYSFDQVRHGDGGQQADDGDHDHDFHEGETALSISLHSLLPAGG